MGRQGSHKIAPETLGVAGLFHFPDGGSPFSFVDKTVGKAIHYQHSSRWILLALFF